MNQRERLQLLSCLEHQAEDLEQTTANLTLYCDAATGDDLCGKGTALAPYATIERAMQDVPRRVAHTVRIYLAAGKYDSCERHIDRQFVDDGSLTICGVGAPGRKGSNGGPHTVASIAAIGSTAQRLTVGGAAWTVDEFVGYWVRVVTGAHVGRAFLVFGNAAGTIDIAQQTDGVHQGDTIEIIEPRTTVTVVDELDIYYDSRSNHGTANSFMRLAFCNLCVDASGSTSASAVWVNGNSGSTEGPVFDFVRIMVPSYGAGIQGVALNAYGPIDTDYVTASDTDIVNLAEAGAGPGLAICTSGGRADPVVAICSDTLIWNTAFSGGVQLGYNAEAMLFGIGAASVMSGGAGHGWVTAWLAGVDASTDAMTVYGGAWEIGVNVVGACRYAIAAEDGAAVLVDADTSCSASATATAPLLIGHMSKVRTSDGCANFIKTGTPNVAYRWKTTATNAAAWPAAAGYATDAKGGELLRTA